MHALRYCLVEAIRSLMRAPGATALSMLTSAVATLVLGGFLLVSVNLERVFVLWSGTAEMSVYLADDITPEQRVALNQVLAASPVVASRTFVSKADALARFVRSFPDLSTGLEDGPDNPLPASIELQLRPQGDDGRSIESLTRELRQTAGVADVRYDRQWLSRLATILSGVRWAGWGLGAVLLCAAVLTVSTIVRLALHARRDEVEIMQLMGAPIGLLRGPLVVEGILHGGGGALVSLALLYALYLVARAAAGPVLATVIDPALTTFLPAGLAGGLVGGGAAVGLVGGWMAARHVR